MQILLEKSWFTAQLQVGMLLILLLFKDVKPKPVTTGHFAHPHHHQFLIMTKFQSKEDWVQEQHDKAVKVHHANIDRIGELNSKIDKKLWEINSLKVAESFLSNKKCQWESTGGDGSYDDALETLTGWFEANQVCAGVFDDGIEVIRKEAIKKAIEIAKLQADIDSNSWDDSVKIMHENTDKEKLGEEYDKLVKAKGTQLLKSLRSNEEAA